MSGVFRHSSTYSALTQKFDEAVEKVWPECFSGEECGKVSHEAKDLQRLVVTSYRLMKFIRAYLTKKRLDYNEAVRFPGLYVALDRAVQVVASQQASLSVEAERLEQVSRAAYHWMKTYKMVPGVAFKPSYYCTVCKTKPAVDDSGLLCSYCSGMIDDEEAGYSPPPQDASMFDEMGFPIPGEAMNEWPNPMQSWRNEGNDMMLSPNRWKIR